MAQRFKFQDRLGAVYNVNDQAVTSISPQSVSRMTETMYKDFSYFENQAKKDKDRSTLNTAEIKERNRLISQFQQPKVINVMRQQRELSIEYIQK